MKNKNKYIGYGWVGRWKDGKIGWNLPEYLEDKPEELTYYDGVPKYKPWLVNQKFWKCKITIEVLPIKKREHNPRILYKKK